MYWRDGSQKPLPRYLDERQRKTVEKEIKHVKVETRHALTKRHYRIARFIKECAREKKFTNSDGQSITVEKYFTNQYRIRLQYPELPLIQLLPKEKNIFLPIEVCYVIGGEHYKKKLDPQATADMVRACAKPAPDRLKDITQIGANCGLNKDTTTQAFGINVCPTLTEVTGRILPAPKVGYAQNKAVQPMKGAWEQGRNMFLQPIKVQNWALYCAEDQRRCDNNLIKDFIGKLQQGARNCGITLPNAKFNRYIRHAGEVRKAMEEIMNSKDKIDFVLFILGRDAEVYNKVKQFGDVQMGIITQCIQSKNVQRVNAQLIGNVLLKLNAKLNGQNCAVPTMMMCYALNQPTIILGADVTHPAPGDCSKPSIAAVTGSLNRFANQYHVEIRTQAHRQETIGSVAEGRPQHAKFRYKKIDFYF